MKRFAHTAATQTGDNDHQRSDAQEREVFARAVQLGTLWTREELIEAQLADVDLQPIYEAKKAGNHKPGKEALKGVTNVARYYMAEWERLYINDGVLMLRWESADCTQQRQRVVLPFCFRDIVMHHLHDSNYAGHLGTRRTITRVAARYFWYKLREDVTRYIRTCDACQRRKRPGKTPRAALTTQNVGFRFERIAMDLCGPMERTTAGNRYVLVIGDYFSKFTMPIAIENKTQEVVAEALVTRWIPLFGMPEVIHTDRGTEFDNMLMRELCERFNITKTRTCSYHPSSNGVIERYNSSFAQIVSTLCNENTEWDMYLPFAQMAYNSTVHDTTGETPNKVVLGTQLKMPIDVMTPATEEQVPLAQSEYVREIEEDMRLCYQRVRERTRRAAACHKNYYDKRKHEVKYRSEDLVMLKTMTYLPFQRKFADRYTGPWAIIEAVSGNCYRIQMTEKSKPYIVHHDRLKPYSARNVDEHNTDWVKRVLARYAAVRSNAPRLIVPPSTGEATDQNDTDVENELLREIGPYDNDSVQTEGTVGVPAPVAEAATSPDEAMYAPQGQSDVGATQAPEMADLSLQVSMTSESESSALPEQDVLPKDNDSNDSVVPLPEMVDRSLQVSMTSENDSPVADAARTADALPSVNEANSDVDSDVESVRSVHSTAEYSVAEFMAPASFRHREQLHTASRGRGRYRSATNRLRGRNAPAAESTDVGSDTVELAESQFMFQLETDTPVRSQRYGLRRKPRQRVTYSP